MSDTTRDILSRCKNGDLNAFRNLVEAHQSYAHALAIRILCNDEDARDVVQESFIRVWKHLPHFDLDKKFSTWLYKIVANLSLDMLKKHWRKNRWIISQTEEHQESISDGRGNPEREYVNRETLRTIKRLSDGLTPKQRIVFVLRDLQDLPMEEVIEITGLSRNAVKSNLYYARLHIRQKLEEPENEL